MSWYKKILKLCQVSLDKSPSYLDIGHAKLDTPEKPNYIWIYENDSVFSELEDKNGKRRIHTQIFPGRSWANIICGRYESMTGRISVYLPDEYKKWGGLPTFIKNKLYEKFPGISKFYYF